jgi:hypothetical protein
LVFLLSNTFNLEVFFQNILASGLFDEKTSKLKVFESKKTKVPKQNSRHWLRSHMSEGAEP